MLFFVRLSRFIFFYESLICQQDQWSTSLGYPPKDGTQNYDLIAASESGSTTVVEFSRDAITGDDAKDVQFMVRLHSNVKLIFFIFRKSACSD